MSLKKYLDNVMINKIPDDNQSNIQSVPPEGIPGAGEKPPVEKVNIQSVIWEVFEKDGISYIILNENKLKEILKMNGIIIADGIINYDKINKIISFSLEDLMGRLSIEQLQFADEVLKFYAINKTHVLPEDAKVIIYINPEFELRG